LAKQLEIFLSFIYETYPSETVESSRPLITSLLLQLKYRFDK